VSLLPAAIELESVFVTVYPDGTVKLDVVNVPVPVLETVNVRVKVLPPAVTTPKFVPSLDDGLVSPSKIVKPLRPATETSGVVT
tara:strand:- start:25476 stop:25727 length:252 start_codon:yes stop_codon:yes gene_type:complete